jgi:hypothetical protein
VTLASSAGVLASKKPASSTPLEFNARSGEMSRSATFAGLGIGGEKADKSNAAKFAYAMLWNF